MNFIKQRHVFLLLVVVIVFSLFFRINKGYGYTNYFDNIPDISTLSNSDLNFPASYDLRNVDGVSYLTPVKNQGNYGLCWAFSATTAFESTLKKSGYVSEEFNEWYSPYQVDALLTKNVKTPDINYVTSYNAKTRTLGSGNQIYSGFKAFTTAYSPVLESTFSEEKYAEHYNHILKNKFNANDVYNEKNSEYYVTDYNILESVNDISTTDVVKYYLYNYGAVEVGTVSPSDNCRDFYGECYINVPNTPDYAETSLHAMTVIGWDDSKNSWILQNSWGNHLTYIYLSYDSWVIDFVGIKKIAKKTWDNRYYATDLPHSSNQVVTEFNKIPDNKEVLDSVLADLNYPGEYDLFVSKDGDNNYELIKTFNVQLSGRKTIDLSDQDIDLESEKFGIKIVHKNYVHTSRFLDDNVDVYVFTKDAAQTSEKKMYIYDIYDITSKKQKVTVKFKTLNINDKSQIQLRIKNNLGEDVTDGFDLKDSYFLGNYGQFEYDIKLPQLPSEYVEYTVEGIVNNKVIASKKMGVSDVDDDFKVGTGTPEDPFIITEFDELEAIGAHKEYLKYSYKLAHDIDADSKTLTPIGDSERPFTGTFDGDNYKIKNLTSFNSNKYFGIFGYTDGATIKNLNIENSGVESANLPTVVGLVAANAVNSTITDIHVEGGTINVTDGFIHKIGTVVGFAKNTNLYNIFSSENILISSVKYVDIGGLVGRIDQKETASNSYIKNSQFSGQMSIDTSSLLSAEVGGIVGYILDDYFEISDILMNGTINKECSGDEQQCSKSYSFGYIAGRFDNSSYIAYKRVTNSIYYMSDEKERILGNYAYKIDNYDNVYAITDYDNTESDRYINKNSERFLNEVTYDLDFTNVWHMNFDGPVLREISNLISKDDIIGESETYDVDYVNKIISNVKANQKTGGLTKKEFIEDFITFSGDIYSSDGVLIESDDEFIKTGMFVRNNSKDYTIIVNGDIDGDGSATSRDIILLRRYLIDMIELNEIQKMAADVLKDNRLSVTDVYALRRAVVTGYETICPRVWRDC